eukprot:CAMPEP_0170515286 /NCGR_PEP_ID=MMETSP0209-20121228/1734_1 /TAXON_ID=665100 ORGANISM="Litonotus pictus, Strain P1" /NCGR_SAMPLE_ID=MMETSP0209 /ASSEMBLY_ACC=CAM_ASM_000301 /LENGTH=252 /DNA_ID=CAMNT_0010799697 /DNA_START=526 /DNA_END=1284 /DNA_ORIENTATION=-
MFFKFHLKLVFENKSTIETIDKKGEEFESSFDMGAQNNFNQVMGLNKVLWFIPYTDYSGQPVGNGIDWSMSNTNFDRFDITKPINNQRTQYIAQQEMFDTNNVPTNNFGNNQNRNFTTEMGNFQGTNTNNTNNNNSNNTNIYNSKNMNSNVINTNLFNANTNTNKQAMNTEVEANNPQSRNANQNQLLKNDNSSIVNLNKTNNTNNTINSCNTPEVAVGKRENELKSKLINVLPNTDRTDNTTPRQDITQNK